jgi:membrane fusion protein (multidrug efflux system)
VTIFSTFSARFFCIFLIIVSFSNCGEKKKKITAQQQQPRAQSIKVDAFIVKARMISESIEVPGTLLANEITQIFPEVSGRVVQINFNEGKYIGKGAVLVKLFDGDLQAQLRKLQVQLKIAEQTESRQAQLLKIQGISQQDYDLSLLSVNNITADIEIIREAIAKTVIRAPYSGRLGLRNISPGAFITPQTNITTIIQTEQLKLDFTVPEKYTDRIKAGQYVNFTVQGKNKPYSARVIATEVSITETTRSLVVRSMVQNKNSELLPGNFANVQLKFDPDPDALMVPSQAIIPQARGKKIVNYNGGNAKFVDVETGVRDSAFVQVTQGIKAGDTIVITGLLSVRPGSKIQVSKIANN